MKVDKDKPELKAYSLSCVTDGKVFYTKTSGSKDKTCPDCGKKKMFECNSDPDYNACDNCGFRDLYTDIP
jgi:DNA-directed RNA polymerase subunit RPC12/RpoP